MNEMEPVPNCSAICHTRMKCTKPAVEGTLYCTRHLNRMDMANTFTHEVFEINLNGIIYYSDKYHHLFSISDIIQRKVDPAIIGRWYMNENENMPHIELFESK